MGPPYLVSRDNEHAAAPLLKRYFPCLSDYHAALARSRHAGLCIAATMLRRVWPLITPTLSYQPSWPLRTVFAPSRARRSVRFSTSALLFVTCGTTQPSPGCATQHTRRHAHGCPATPLSPPRVLLQPPLFAGL